MRKIYAVLKPAYVGNSENCLVCIDIAVILWHRASYENICGYSLGHAAQFHADLNGAIHSIARTGYDVIAELDIDELNHITAIYAIECSEVKEKFIQDAGTQFFSRVKVPVWTRREIHSHEMTSGAMAELQRQYHSSYLANAAPIPSAPPQNEISTEIYGPGSQQVMHYTPKM
jgi:hypothetical protein